MKKKSLGYVSFILFMCLVIFTEKISSDGITHYMRYNLKTPMILFLTTAIVLHIGFGFLMGAGYLLREKAREGKWRINISKLIIIGLPSLVFGLMTYLIFLLRIPTQGFMRFFISGTSTYMTLFKVLFGYVVAISFYKESNIGEADVKNEMAYSATDREK